MPDVCELDLSAPEVAADPVAAYLRTARQTPVARLSAPGFGPVWAVTRYHSTRAMLADPRLVLRADSYLRPPVPDRYRPYLDTMQQVDGADHARLRRLVAPAFTARRTAAARPVMHRIVDTLLADLPGRQDGPGAVDLVSAFAHRVPIEIVCDLVGIAAADRPRWRDYGAAIAAGNGPVFVAAVPDIIDDALAAVAAHRAAPGADVISELIAAQTADPDRLTDTELVALVWQLLLAGQTPSNLIGNAVHALLTHPDQWAALRADPGLLPGAVDELLRWCGPQLLSFPRFATEDLDLAGVRVRRGDAVSAVLVAANRDPEVFVDPDRLDVRRTGAAGHLGFAHGPHFCLGAGLARTQTAIALGGLLDRFPDLTLAADDVHPTPDPGTWRLAALPVRLAPA